MSKIRICIAFNFSFNVEKLIFGKFFVADNKRWLGNLYIYSTQSLCILSILQINYVQNNSTTKLNLKKNHHWLS